MSDSQSVSVQMQNKVRKAKESFGRVRKVGKGKERQEKVRKGREK